jgi:hypothetical protein
MTPALTRKRLPILGTRRSSGRPKQVMMVLPGMAARQISVDIIGVPPATTRIRQPEREPQDSIEIASEIEPGVDDVGAEDDRLVPIAPKWCVPSSPLLAPVSRDFRRAARG